VQQNGIHLPFAPKVIARVTYCMLLTVTVDYVFTIMIVHNA